MLPSTSPGGSEGPMTDIKVRPATPSDRPPEDLKKERDAFIQQFFRKGAQFTEELLKENERLRDRINALSTFFGDGSLDVDFPELGRRAEKVRTVACDVRWEERFRTSSKTRQRHELSGFVGEASYEGDLTEFLPWFTMGELIHIGKHTPWGNGWMEIVPSG